MDVTALEFIVDSASAFCCFIKGFCCAAFRPCYFALIRNLESYIDQHLIKLAL